MNNREINDAIENGIRLSQFPIQDIEDKLIQIIGALDYLGIDFNFFQEKTMTTKIASVLKTRYGYLTDHELTIIISSGCQGEFKKSYQIVKGYSLFGWLKEYLEERQRILQEKRDIQDDDLNHKRYDVVNSPVGSAIVWKMNRVKLDDWETIPLKKIAEAIRRKENMDKFAESYGIELINRN